MCGANTVTAYLLRQIQGIQEEKYQDKQTRDKQTRTDGSDPNAFSSSRPTHIGFGGQVLETQHATM